MTQTAEQLYLSLIRLPHSQWAGVIGSLNCKLKQDLLALLQKKRLGKTSKIETKVNDIDRSSVLSDAGGLALDSQLSSIKSETDTDSVSPNTHCVVKRRRTSSVVSKTAVLKKKRYELADTCEKALRDDASGPKQLFKRVSEDTPINEDSLPLRVLGATPLVHLRRLMFVAGDSCDVSTEAEHLVHRYLNVWLCCVFTRYFRMDAVRTRTATSPSATSLQAEATPRYGIRNRKRVAQQLGEYIESRFCDEYAVYSNKISLQKTVRNRFSGCVSGLDVDGVEVSGDNAEGHLLPSSVSTCRASGFSTNTVEETSSLDATPKKRDTERNLNQDEIQRHLRPDDRYAERLATQDFRTRQFNVVEYETFARSKEKSLRATKRVFTEWVNLITSLASISIQVVGRQDRDVSCSSASEATLNCSQAQDVMLDIPLSQRVQLMSTSIDFLVFLVSDRIASVVELALRIRASLNAGAVCSCDSNFLLPSRLADAPNLFNQMWAQGFRLPSLSDAVIGKLPSEIKGTATDYRAGDCRSVMSSDTGKSLLPQYYEAAIVLLLRLVDAPMFGFGTSELESSFMRGPTYNISSTHTGPSLPEATTKAPVLDPSASKEFGAKGTATVFSQLTEMPCSSSERSGDGETTNASAPSLPTTAEEQLLFNCVVQTALQHTGAPNLPDELVTFAFLKCRDLFWEYRHQQPQALWHAIRERYNREKRSETTDFAQFKQTHKKILHYGEALHKIVAVGSFFKDVIEAGLNTNL